MKIAILGAGNLGLSIAKGILESEPSFCTSLYLTKRNPTSLQAFAKYPQAKTGSDNLEAMRHSDIIIVSVQPGQLVTLLEEIKLEFTEKKLVISTVTGRNIAVFESVLGTHIPIIRSMPNTASAVAQSMTCLSANMAAQNKVKLAEAVFKPIGKTLLIEDEMMQAATVICASGIAFWMRLIRATTQGAIQLGFDASEAKELAVQTCLGAASLLLESENHPETEIDKVTTPRGCTIAGLNEMEHAGMSSALIKGLVKSYEKINSIK
ncbi:MAG: pyrroline-5-carboxylate reductase [Flavobacteriales bacterium CG_4_9_14_3_um_filter_40_17]|nr:MAG: pyrroline-5-carboxylate reductase [Flavobacteriales bacterium CG_4_9_14_3_um_filter_40_17]